ncbi:hypothetical protein JMJ58_19185 [Haloterrigena salifodinae]|uniref:Uncharacterized protein n=1 Tax=Haloterrigena salifodinae TaxID=2675099 RepID=A0A8T8E052_9EURY|nr:hypothetical protein [Haloterrigena salifodinae]QRV15007.1 hypothetical protein JMJ58_19185 [Haloterrigena salifodinae]
MNIPEIIVVGDIEMLFLGMALAAGMPRMARRILARRYGTDDEIETDEKCDDCPTPDDCAALGCRRNE